jgi:hypothetical protein
MVEIPDNLPDLTRELMSLRKKPTTEERFKAYPQMLQRFNDLVKAADDPAPLKQVLEIDTGYYLPAGYRQQVIEKLLSMERTPQMLRAYALQLELFGDVDEYGEANIQMDARIDALHAEADRLEQQNNESN